MDIYSTNDYRKIWKHFNGPIPVDEDGRTYEIHHIDGNRKNNDISNLVAVSIDEHYDIHYNNGDYGACYKIAKRKKLSPEEISDLVTKSNLSRSANGTHPWKDREKQSQRAKQRVLEGKCAFTSELAINRNKKWAEEGKHPSQTKEFRERASSWLSEVQRIKKTCPHCGKTMNAGNYARYHGDKCKSKITVINLETS